LLCKKHAIKHKLTNFRHPWTNEQVERTNQAIKDATTKTHYYDSLKHLKMSSQILGVDAGIFDRNEEKPKMIVEDKMRKTHSHFGIYGCLKRDSSILLIKKARGPYEGMYDLPGGSPEQNETNEETFIREVKEETGLDVTS